MPKNYLRLAPMMGYTNAPFRLLLHLINPKVQLFSEMITVNAVINNPQGHYFTKFSEEKNTAVQLGGDSPKAFEKVIKSLNNCGFTEININCGCPSNRVKKGNFGACLMKEPQLVARIVKTCKDNSPLPITVKHRLGIDKIDNFQLMENFVNIIVQAGCDGVIVHARNAWLNGISPRQNRKIPPLLPQRVAQLKQSFPDLNICYNGGLKNLNDIKQYANENPSINGIMIGRLAWNNPWIFSYCKNFSQPHPQTRPQLRSEVIKQYFAILSATTSLNHLWNNQCRLKPLINLFTNGFGANIWRRKISEQLNQNWQDSQFFLIDLARDLENQRSQEILQ